MAEVVTASARVFGFGIGLFFLLAFGLLFALIVVLTSKSAMSGGITFALMLLYSVLIMVLTLTPKVAPGDIYQYPSQVDNTYYGKIVFVSFMIFFGLIGVASIASGYLFTPIYAKRPDHEDE